MSFLSLFGPGNRKIREALRQGGTIIDIRPAGSYDQGKIRRSYNIPVDRIDINLERIRGMRKPIIVCSNSAPECDEVVSMLKRNGIEQAISGGNWTTLLRVIRSL